MSISALRIKALERSYGAKQVLNISDLILDKGIYQIKGVNGSGKTTLFDCLAGLIPFKGEVNLDGRGVKSSAYKLKVNYSQSTPAFPDFLSGRDMIDLFARLKRADLNQPDELINLFNVSSFINSSIETYSSGMLKKVSIVIAFLGNPDWIILDEPFITLDVQSQEILADLIARVHDNGTSFLFATHQDILNTHVPKVMIYELIDGKLLKH